MHEVGRKIVYGNLQLQKGNSQKKVQQELARSLDEFKSLSDDNEFNEVFDYLYGNKSTNSYITANLFPSDMNSFAEYREGAFTNNFDCELRWLMKILDAQKENLNIILEYKKYLEELILLNRYEEALGLLSVLEAQFAMSYWLLENRIFLSNKLEKDTQIDIVKKAKSGVLATILGFYNMRSSNEVSSRDYDYFTRKEIAKFKRVHPECKRIISFYHYMISPFSFILDDENIIYIMGFTYNLPLIDRYLYFVDMCEYILTHEESTGYKSVLYKYISYVAGITDSSLDVFRFMLDTSENRRNNYTLDDPLIDVKQKYISGEVETCYQDVVKSIEEKAPDATTLNIYIELCQILGKECTDIKTSDNIRMLLYNLNSVYSIDDRYNDAIDEIYKLCFSCIHAVWARDIYNHITRRNQPYKSNLQQVATMYTNMQKLTIETVCENLSREDALEYLENLSENNKYYVFWKEYIAGHLKKAREITKLSFLNTLLYLIESRDYKDFEKELAEDNRNIPIYKIRYIKTMWDNVTYDTYIEEAIDYFLQLFFVGEDYAVIAPMQKFMNYFSEVETVDKSNLRVPILFYIYTTYFDMDKRDELSIVCEDFFYYNDIEKPSLMGQFREYSKEALIFFLRYVCIPQIMGPVLLSIKNSKDLDQERINTCQYLRTLDSDNESVYEQEIRDITHKLFINEGLNSIENSKIHVNTEGIKSRIAKNLKSAFNNYMYYRNHKLDAVLETIKNIEGGEKLKIIALDATQMFNEIIYTIRNEFVSSGEYGLDGYLSLNIRHGTLAAQLRAPLAKYFLLTTYMIETDSYEVNERWLYKAKSDSDREIIINAIVEFNKETDGIIEYLRKTLIQVSTEEKPSEGVFNYSLDESMVNYLQTLLTENSEFEEFIDKVFDYLWNMTESNLNKMKEIIRDDIKRKYIQAFTHLSNVIKKIHENSPFPEAIRWLNEAQNEIDAELEKICNWFKRSAESQHADFDLDLAFQIGFKMIENIHPEKRFEVTCLNKDLAFKIPGAYLKNYWNIFYTLFDNVSKYALEIDGVNNISCDLKVDDSKVYIKMINDYDCSNGVTIEETKINNAMKLIADAKYLARAQQEGGSGIPKIYKIMSVDLDKKASIQCAFVCNENKFVIEIEGRTK